LAVGSLDDLHPEWIAVNGPRHGSPSDLGKGSGRSASENDIVGRVASVVQEMHRVPGARVAVVIQKKPFIL
jgi:hypothetical protein